MSARPHLEAFEPRLLYSADALSLALGLSAVASDDAWMQAAAHTSSAAVATHGVEIVVLDTSVADAAALLNDLTAQQAAGRQLEVLTLHAGEDGIARITELLAQRHNISALHVLGHGADGLVLLGGSQLNSATLLARAGEIASWGRAFSADADFLIYGCDVAAGANGQQLVNDLAAITGTDVAASTDATASALRGGNWLLEDQTGHIETSLAISSTEQQNYTGSLGTINVTRFTDDNDPGSLRWAITQANLARSADTITLSAGTYVLSASAVGFTANAGRDLDINSSITIIGAGAGQTVIESQGSWRHFEVNGGDLNLSGVTLRGGQQSNTDTSNEESRGGAIYVRSGASLVLSQVVIENSSAQNGGAIYVAGTATLTDVELRNNSARSDGGGLYDAGNTSLSRVTVAQNRASNNGGGIYKNGAQLMTLSNLTLSGNAAGNSGGGLFSSAGTSGGSNSGNNRGPGNDVTNVNLVNASVVSNTASGAGGGLYLDADTQASVVNSLFATNTSDTSQRWTHANKNLLSAGYNLYDIGGDGLSFGMTKTGDHATADISLAALASNNSNTRTHALRPDSGAINAASNLAAPSTDQRGEPRQGNADIGAFEYINATPYFGDVALTIGAGGTAGPTLGLFDFEGDAITVEVVSVTHGKFTLSSDPARAVTSFSGFDLYDGSVRFVHDGSTVAPTFALRASDAFSSSAVVAGTVYFTPANSAPAVNSTVSSGAFLEDTVRTITQAQLLAGVSDANGDPLVAANLQVLTPGAGTLLQNTNPVGGRFGLGSGLKAEYFNTNGAYTNINFGGTPALTRTEAIDFAWGNGSPGPGVSNDNFSVRWSGYIVPPTTGKYTLRTESDDGIRVWVNGNLLIDAWNRHQVVADTSNQIDLQADTAYTIRVEYFEEGRGATARLQWQTPGSSTFSVIPTARLFASLPTKAPQWQFTPASNWNGTVNLSLDVSDGRGGSVVANATLTVAPVNDTPSITFNKLTITEGGTGTPQITSFDPDNPPASTLTITASNVTHGRFALTTNLAGNITSFTQAQLNADEVRFVHDGSSVKPGYRLAVTDAANATSASQAADVAFNPINDAPVFVTNTLNITNAATVLPVIVATDEDNTAAQLTFTVTNVTGGAFALNTGTVIVQTTSFTQQDVNAGRVSFMHDGLGIAPSYDLTVSDGTLVSSVSSAVVTFNNSNATPVMLTNVLTLNEGDVATPVIATSDANDSDPVRRIITASDVKGGYFAHSNDLNFEVTSFTQLDVDNDQIRFVHNGTNFAPSYRLTVSDPSGASATSLAAVTFTQVNDAPVLVVNMLAINEGGSAVPWIEATDEESTAAQLNFTVSNLSGGQFELSYADGVSVLQFTQAQIDSGGVVFVADGGELAPAYSITVSDGTATSAPIPVNIGRFTSVNDRPVFTQNSLTISEGGSAQPQITITDPDNTPGELTITATDVRGGHFERNGPPGGTVFSGGLGSVVEEVIDSFTYAQFLAGDISFVHDGSELTPSYTLTVADSLGATDISALSNVAFTPVNDLPYFVDNTLVIREGGMAAPSIKVLDPDNAADDLRISVTAVSGGRFELTSNAGRAITSFTQSQVDKGLVRFVDGGLGSAPAYSLSVTDPALLFATKPLVRQSEGTVTFTAVNDAPVFTSNRLDITEGGVARPSINVTDEDHGAAQITITVSNVSGGRFEFVGAKDAATTSPITSPTTSPTTSFTQADLNAGHVRFVHDGSNAAPRYTLTATDSDGAQSSSTLGNVSFTAVNDKPVFVVNALTVTEGGMAMPQIQVTDEDNSAAALRFSVSALVGGRFELLSAPGAAISQFTQAQLDAGAVRYVHDGSEVRPGYTLSVSDVEGAQATSAEPALNYTQVNDAPLVLDNQLRITEAGFAVPTVKVSDVDTAAEQLNFTVAAVSGGRFELVSASGVGILNFTQAQLDAGAVRFVHDGSFDVPRYRLALSDGNTVVSSDAAITFTRLPPQPAVVTVTATATATTSTSTGTTTSATATPTAKPASTSAADVLANRAAAAEMAAAEAAAADAQAHANSQATAASNGNAAASSAGFNEGRDNVARGASPAGTGNANANANGAVEVDSRWATASVASAAGAGVVNVQNLLLSGDANSLDWNSSSSKLLDRKLLDAVLGSSDSSVRNTALDKAFERIREELDQGAQADGQAVAGSLVLSTSFSVGYVLWLARGGVLLASMASSIPAWATVDPLPVLSRFKARQSEGDDGFGGADGEPNGNKADALERLFSKAKKVFSGSDSVAVAAPATVPPAPAPTTPTPTHTLTPNSTALSATEASGVTP